MAKPATARVLRILEVPMLIAAPVCLALCAVWQTDQSALISSLLVLACVALIFASFEASRPPLRQIMPTVVLSALAAAGRILFAPVPSVQPVSAIAIMGGAVFDRRCGFLVGVLAMFISNFFLGQGPWTAWQMYGYGLMGYLAGILAEHGAFGHKTALYAYALAAPIVAYGFLMNSWYLIGYVHPITWEAALLTYGAGVPMDLAHSASCVVFLLVLYEPWRRKLERIKRKYSLVPEGRAQAEGAIAPPAHEARAVTQDERNEREECTEANAEACNASETCLQASIARNAHADMQDLRAASSG